MRVALLSCNGRARNAIGNQLAAKAAYFLERGAETRVFLQDAERLHPALRSLTQQLVEVKSEGSAWDYLSNSDLVIADYAQYYDLLHYLPLLVGRKPRLFFDYHGVTPAAHWEGPQRRLLERSERERGFVWCAQTALAHSQFAKEELERATGYPAERIRVHFYPTDAKLFQPGGGSALRRRLGLDAEPVLLYVGRLAASKRVPVLIEALTYLPGAHAVIIGDGGDVYGSGLERCRNLAQQLGVAERLHFLGTVDERDLAEAYRAADALVIPSVHEGYCLPVIEAMASGLPVIAARATALPETVGDAGLTFTPDDPRDLARQVHRVLSSAAAPLPSPPRTKACRIAVVSFRFGAEIVGGAEASLRTIAHTLRRGGHHVEVFTTCTSQESAWVNELPAGAFVIDGLTVHRFPIDAHDRAAHHASIRSILAADGRVDAAAEAEFLRHSLHSSKLVDALRRRESDFDAVIVGPYLFGLTHVVARVMPDKTLLVPCFHDEAFARLRAWQESYPGVGGILYHSPEEQDFAQRVLGLNHPRAREIGTYIDIDNVDCPSFSRDAPRSAEACAPRRIAVTPRYVLYCGRYSAQKNVPLLLAYAERYHRERPGRFQFVFAGQGEVRIPEAAWASNRGRVTEEDKRRLLADAAAVVQLSCQESLSLVVLEAWAQGTPVIVNVDCAVLRAQTARAQGGRAIAGYDQFAAALDHLWDHPDAWQTLGAQGRAYVAQRYGSETAFRLRLLTAVDSLRTPLAESMCRRGLQRAAERDRSRWSHGFDDLVDRVLHEEVRTLSWSVDLEPQTGVCRAAVGTRSLLIPVRIVNRGEAAAFADGPAKTELVAEIVEHATGKSAAPASRTVLPGLVTPGQSLPAALLIPVPAQPGAYEVMLWAECAVGEACRSPRSIPLVVDHVPLNPPGCRPSDLVQTIQSALAEAHRLQRLPIDYVDVTEGRFARWKRWLKQKLLGNFKKAYVDVLSEQQSQVNQHLLLAVQRLADYCAMLEHALNTISRDSPSSQHDERQPAIDRRHPEPRSMTPES